MSYQQHLPHPLLRDFIDAYWVVRNDEGVSYSTRILPDGCIDIIMNAGEDYRTSDGFRMRHGCKYLVGTMTHYIDVESMPGTCVVGIRFKPLGFSAFYKFGSLHEIANQTIDLEEIEAPSIQELNARSINKLDRFYLERLSTGRSPLYAIIDHVKLHRGNMTVDSLSATFAMSGRKIERDFKQHLGVTPKEFINFKRYEHAMARIRDKQSSESLLDIAIDCGYYDHAHLTNEVRRHSGSVPSLV